MVKLNIINRKKQPWGGYLINPTIAKIKRQYKDNLENPSF